MNPIVAICLLALLLASGCAKEQPKAPPPDPVDLHLIRLMREHVAGYEGKDPRVGPMESPREGVFQFRNRAFSGLVLELRQGRFRYWFFSDVPCKDTPRYPVEGTYTTQGPVISLLHPHRLVQKKWIFLELDGKPSLWRPSALEYWVESEMLSAYGVLREWPGELETLIDKRIWPGDG